MAADVKKNILIGVDLDDNFSKDFKALEKNYKKGLSQFDKEEKAMDASRGKLRRRRIANDAEDEVIRKKKGVLTDIQETLGLDDLADASTVMKGAGFQFDKFGGVVDASGNSVDNFMDNIHKGTGKLANFEMAYLGVMFAGMSLQKAMAGLTATSSEWLGIQDMMNTTMGVVFLPIMSEVAGVLYPLLGSIMDMPAIAKLGIGALTIGLQGLGTVMMVGGQLALGLNSTVDLLNKMKGKRITKYNMEGLGRAGAKLATFWNSESFKGIRGKAGRGAQFLIGASVMMSGVSELTEGNITSGVGRLMTGAGFMMIGRKGALGKAAPWVMAAGIALEVVGNEDAQRKIARTMIKITDMFFTAGDVIKSVIRSWFTGAEIDWGGFNFGDIYREEFEKMGESGDLNSKKMIGNWVGMGASAENYDKKLQDINDQLEESDITIDQHTKKVSALNDEYKDLINYEAKVSRKWAGTSLQDKAAAMHLDLTAPAKSGSVHSALNEYIASGGKDFSYGSKAIGSNRVPKTGPYILHEGEQVIQKSRTQSQNGNVTITYNVTVSDKREFEQMLRQNNTELTRELRRRVNV